MLSVREGPDEMPGALPRLRDGVSTCVRLREETVGLELLEVEREFRRGIDEILLQDPGIGHRSGREDETDDRAANRVSQRLEHGLKAFGSVASLGITAEVGREFGFG